jgi:hypothetical protein
MHQHVIEYTILTEFFQIDGIVLLGKETRRTIITALYNMYSNTRKVMPARARHKRVRSPTNQ